ncbi:zona pellucida-binding protein 1 isoform X4 [Dermochelys coriacea]|uniref:zona pellucida-binding protein 1 isoform X4 n=1 Tax=Dermochelys coriacea TaxID=27794 RepID=UPI001CA7DFC9|nr:zona pellucida-binding protein 1 isoform X4 [Dermochelys coriacea]
MADSPPGAARRRGRGWRRRRRVGAFPSSAFRLPALGVTFLFLLLQRPPAVQSSRRFSGSANPKHNDLKIVGSTTFPVKIYVKLNHNSPRILCVTNRLRNSELIDPVFQWHGPGGDLVAENSSVKITPTGTLIFRHFKYDMSGIYTCSLVFKPTAEQAEKNYLLKYVIYVSSLDTEKNNNPCQQKSCDTAKRLKKAKDLIERFFNQQVEVLGKRSEPLPEIYYIEGTLQMVWVNRCYPGYGINALIHPDCPDCCVVCSPGSYNPHDGVHCLQCNHTLIYGGAKC